MNIALLGVTGHVARNLEAFFKEKNKIYRFSREPIDDAMPANSIYADKYFIHPYSDLQYYDFDVIINCVGFGNPADVEKAGIEILSVTNQYDDMCLQYLEYYPETKYVYISSGVASNPLDTKNLYQLSKVYTEAKHRAMPDFNIIDIRLYSFFTRYSNLNASFFMSQLVKAVRDKTEFVTDESIMWRDYINPYDLYNLVQTCLNQKKFNGYVETYSLSPIEKFEILEYFKDTYNVRIKYLEHHEGFSSANDPCYYSKGKSSIRGFKPKYDSLSTIIEETEGILLGHIS
jgi:hypothetical protein